ncbi:MAG: hypothetical protein CMA50_01750 [Euryarchaeota archaeon]|jgi:hypothetical protein|nr:hypothetical protein [Euryarchaeota archaeon]|tara:strand:+ start:941 stop:1402 length:462 start_codon:yes stop_codon:yes gene_type:complete
MWRKVDVVGSETLGEELEDNLDRGLDMDAETMHQRFLADLPHLESAKNNHNEVLTKISDRIYEAKTHSRSLDSQSVAFEELDRDTAKEGFDIILDKGSLSQLSVTTAIDDGRRLIRVIAPERFGGMIRTLSVPSTMDVESAIISDGVLHLSFD